MVEVTTHPDMGQRKTTLTKMFLKKSSEKITQINVGKRQINVGGNVPAKNVFFEVRRYFSNHLDLFLSVFTSSKVLKLLMSFF